MRFTMPSTALTPVLSSMAHVAGRANVVLPVLAGVLLEVKPDAVRITAYNLSHGLETTLARPEGTEPFEAGALVVGADVLYQLSRTVAGDVTLESNDDSVVLVSYPGGQMRLSVIAASDFPRPHFARTSYEFPAGSLREGFARVAYAVGQDDAHPVLSGVRLRVSEGRIDLLATDRSRVAYFGTAAEGLGEGSVVLDAPALSLIARLCDAETVRLGWDGHGLTALWKTTRLYSRVPDGTFPNLETALPENYAAKAKLDLSAFAAAVARVGLLADPSVTVALGPEGLTIASHSALGAGREVVSAEVEGQARAGFGPTLLTAALSHLKGSTLTLEMTDAESPMRLSVDDRGYAVVMPVVDEPVRSAPRPAEAVEAES